MYGVNTMFLEIRNQWVLLLFGDFLLFVKVFLSLSLSFFIQTQLKLISLKG